jgi:hypothetical protein
MTDPTSSSKLALIYSKLAELELQKEKNVDIWGDIKKKYTLKDIPPQTIHDIEHIFRDAVNKPAEGKEENSKIDAEHGLTVENFTVENVDQIRLLFLAEQQFSESLHESLTKKIHNVSAIQIRRDDMVSEILRLRETLIIQEKKIKDYEELCRNLTKLFKERDDNFKALIENEKQKSLHLESECVNAIDTVTKKIEEEEADLLNTSNENAELKTKLE